MEDKIFGPPLQRGNPLPGEPFGKLRREWKTQIGTALLDAVDRRAFHGRLQAALDGLYFG